MVLAKKKQKNNMDMIAFVKVIGPVFDWLLCFTINLNNAGIKTNELINENTIAKTEKITMDIAKGFCARNRVHITIIDVIAVSIVKSLQGRAEFLLYL